MYSMECKRHSVEYFPDSKVMTKLFRDEDKRREVLPPHCVFCLYIPPEDFTPGKEPVAGGPFLLRDKEPPRPLMSCACKSKKATCAFLSLLRALQSKADSSE